MNRIAILLLALPAFLSLPAAQAQDVPGMPSFEEVLSLRSVGSARISPDGQMVAYTIRSTDWDENTYDTEIWIARADGSLFQLTRTADGSSSSPEWSPDGRWIAFAADRGEGRQIHLIAVGGGEARAITDLEGGVGGFSWAPTGERILLSVQETESAEAKAREERYGAFEIEDAEWRNAHLWVLSVDGDGEPSEVERLTDGDFHAPGGVWSPDGSRVAYARYPDARMASSVNGDIYVLDVESGNSTPLVEGPGPDRSPVWSPDGEWILFSEYEGDLGSYYYLNGELARIPSAGGSIEILTRGFDEDPGGAVWTEAGIRFGAGNRTERLIYTLDPETGAIEAMDLPTPVVGSYSFTPDGKALAFTGQSGESLAEVYRAWGADSGRL
jgi:Tol biopolymer transport system component